MSLRGIRLVLGGLLLSGVQYAQTTGSIDGRVTDPSGASLSGVTVEVTSPNLQGTRSGTTDAGGIYRIPAIPPGQYRLMARFPGFAGAEKTCLVSLGSAMTVDVVLRVEAAEQVVVSGKAPQIDQTTTTTGTRYTFDMVNHLPVQRNYADIARSDPGANTDRGFTDGGRFVPLTIYGATSSENQWLIDGVNTTNVRTGTQGKALSSEFIQEIEVKTGGYQAEYGRALGGIVNAVTKSGGNTFHGDSFAYYDSSQTTADRRFEAEDLIDAGTELDDGTRLDYGFDLGGFLLKDRLWFFGAYNRVTLDAHVSRVNASPYVPADYLFPLQATDNLYSGKLTWNASPSTTVVGSAFADPSASSGLGAADPRRPLGDLNSLPPKSTTPSTWDSTRSQGGTDYTVQGTELFGSDIVATLQGSYHQGQSSLTAADEVRQEDWTCLVPDSPCRRLPRLVELTGGFGYIVGGNDSVTSRQQYNGTATFYQGPHEVKVGVDYMDAKDRLTFSFTGGQLVGKFNDKGQTYYQHQFFAKSLDDLTPVPAWNVRAQVLDYGAYVQDSWKAAPGLTVNAGLRWDGETTHNDSGATVFQFNDLWQPRIGLVWDPWQNGRTKIWASAGRFGWALPTLGATSLFYGDAVQVRTYNFDPVSVVQDPNVLGHGRPEGGAVSSDVPVDDGLEGFSQDEVLFGVERDLGQGLTVGVKGTYRRLNNAIDLRADLDPAAGQGSYAVINPGSGGTYASGDVPTCNGLDPPYYACTPSGPETPKASRLYRGIEFLVRQTVGDSLWLQASYVHSSLRGNDDGGSVTSGAFYSPASWNNAYGPLDLDRPNRFRFDGYWTTPLKLSLGLQAFVESGTPMNRWTLYSFERGPTRLDPRGSTGRFPTLWEANLQLSYPLVFGPVTATLQAYLFNVFNNQIATSRDEDWSYEEAPGYPETIYDPNQPQTNPDYGKFTGRYAPRFFRAAVRISF